MIQKPWRDRLVFGDLMMASTFKALKTGICLILNQTVSPSRSVRTLTQTVLGNEVSPTHDPEHPSPRQ